MTLQDSLGLAVTGAGADGLAHFEAAQSMLRCYVGDPVASIDRALAESPQMVMGHAMRAWLHLLATESPAIAVARQSLEAARSLPANHRETGHLAAIEALIAGRWHAAGRILEDVSVEHPHDALALQVGHQLDFFTGNARMLRDRIARALPHWSPVMPGYHAVLGMHAFGLEETGDYSRAEAAGRRAVEIEPRDGWAQHAVAHVMEMEGRRHDGVAWMRANPEAWSRESFFAVHNWWHLALFHLGLDQVDETLALFDERVDGSGSTIVLEMVDASAMLWRLHLRGVPVGDRWRSLAERWQRHASAGNYAFNDAHAAMAFIGAGRDEDLAILRAAQERAVHRDDDNAAFTREVGRPVVEALIAFRDARYDDCILTLRAVREIAHRFGGSHAQRDLLDLTLVEAALRAGRRSLVDALTAERSARVPHAGRTARPRARRQEDGAEVRAAG